MNDLIKELVKYLQIGSRLDLKDYALTQILGLTGAREGLDLVQTSDQVLLSLITLLDDPNATVSKDSCLILVNISANPTGARNLMHLDIPKVHTNRLVKPPENIIKTLIRFILNPECHFADAACMVFSNLSRNSALVETIVDCIDEPQNWEALMSAFTKIKYNQKGGKLDYLGPIFSNLSQSPTVRKVILNRESSLLQRLITFTEYEGSITRRGGVIGTLKNCCFDTEYHEWLLGEDVDILPRLLLPLAGPEEFDDEDNDKLPADLQFLEADKKREEDPDIRCMLLEAVTQLCALRKNRELIREKNAYVILRELHKWETDKKALLACENLVDILIRTEEEIAEDDLKSLQIPEDVQEKIEKLNLNAIE